jgi:aminoglycoside phosphotransferase
VTRPVDRPPAGFDNGWDASAELVGGIWVDRMPRRPEVAAGLERETVLLPWLAPQLPLPVPEPVVVSRMPLRVRHRLIAGDRCPGDDPAHGRQLGGFLARLHRVDVDTAVRLGAPDAERARQATLATLEQFHDSVLPLLDHEDRAAGSALLDRLAAATPVPALIHGDLGADHIRVEGPMVTGIIDWTDACVGDPALDLAWTAFGTTAAFAREVTTTYGASDELLARGLDWHRLGPWYEVTHGQDTGAPHLVHSGISGVTSRLRELL